MRIETVQYLSEKEEELVTLLIQLGMNRVVALVLVFLLNIGKGTSKEIERGTGLRQPEVSIAVRHLKEFGWIDDTEFATVRKGRPIKIIKLVKSKDELVNQIQTDKKNEISKQSARVKQLRQYY